MKAFQLLDLKTPKSASISGRKLLRDSTFVISLIRGHYSISKHIYRMPHTLKVAAFLWELPSLLACLFLE